MSYVKYRMINYISFKDMNVIKFIVNIEKKIICIEIYAEFISNVNIISCFVRV